MHHAQFPALFDKFESTRDRGMKCVYYTRELTPQEQAVLLAFAHSECFLTISATPFANADVLPTTPPAKLPDGRTQSQLLRAALYRLWEARRRVAPATTADNFDLFYQDEMGRIIGTVKKDLNQYD